MLSALFQRAEEIELIFIPRKLVLAVVLLVDVGLSYIRVEGGARWTTRQNGLEPVKCCVGTAKKLFASAKVLYSLTNCSMNLQLFQPNFFYVPAMKRVSG